MYEKIDNERLAMSINDELDEYRPKWKDFEEIYPKEKIEADKAELANYRKKKNIDPKKDRDKLKDGLLIEKIFHRVDMDDYFDEGSLYGELMTEDTDFSLYAFPAHEYDDTFNNADIICVVCNKLTDHKPITFAVDCTSNSVKVEEKMNYERTANKITGFTDLEYFYDTDNFGDDKPHKLEKVPRFVAGFNADLAREIITSDYNDWTKDDLNPKYDQVGYYLLTELAAQARINDTGLDKYFDRLLEHFMETHDSFDVSLYPKDAVMEEVLITVGKKQQPEDNSDEK